MNHAQQHQARVDSLNNVLRYHPEKTAIDYLAELEHATDAQKIGLVIDYAESVGGVADLIQDALASMSDVTQRQVLTHQASGYTSEHSAFLFLEVRKSLLAQFDELNVITEIEDWMLQQHQSMRDWINDSDGNLARVHA